MGLTRVGLMLRSRLLSSQEALGALFAFLLIGIGVFGVALSFVPAEGDDLILLSSVANAPTPFGYLIGDWGLGNHAYRPLHSILLWLTYRVVGIWAFPNQFINLALHFVVVILLYNLIQKTQQDKSLSFLLASLSLVSMYTMESVAWVSDRPTLFVAIWFLLLLIHFSQTGQGQRMNLLCVGLTSVLALMSKESGLIVPLFAFLFGLRRDRGDPQRGKLLWLSSALILCYLLFRLAIFRSNAFTYSPGGYLFGTVHYENRALLPISQQALAVVENTAKNVIAPFLPVFDWEGGFLPLGSMMMNGLIWLPTLLLALLSIDKRGFSSFQKAALAVIVLSSLLHYAEFRYRTQYVSQLAFCLFVASSIHLKRSLNRQVVGTGLAAVLLLYSVFWVGRILNTAYISRYEMLYHRNLAPVVEKSAGGVDPHIVAQVLELYGPGIK